MGRQQTLDAADAIAIFDFGAEAMFVPVASGTLEGAGFYDTAQSASLPAMPLDASDAITGFGFNVESRPTMIGLSVTVPESGCSCRHGGSW